MIEIGRVIGHYRIIDRLGAGGMGEVWLAEDIRLHRRVALKVLAPHLATPQHRERFEREAQAVAALNHPNIVTIYSVEEHEELCFLTMELVEGQPLTEQIPQGGLPLRRFLDLAVQLADAIEAAHERGIIHRDLKPDNVMVSREGRVKVLDFGIAKLEAENAATVVDGQRPPTLTQIGNVVGTAGYMSPEQILGRAVDHRTDLFSLGVVLYQMATGQRPFVGGHHTEVMASILRDRPAETSSLNPQLPPVLDQLVASCLEKDPARRPQHARDLRQSLQALATGLSASLSLSGMPPGAIMPATTTFPVPARRRRRAQLAAAAAVVVLVPLSVVAPRLGRRLAGATTPAVVPAMATMATTAAVARPALAVLPLGNYSDGPEYFSDGMTDALIASLADIRGVRVISRQSVMRYKDSAEPLPDIARELGVEMVVQGSVLRAGDRVRITAQLVRATPEQQIWAESYEGDLRDVLSLQKTVARAITDEIKVKIEPQERERLAAAKPVDPDAYDAYLRGRHALGQRRVGGFNQGLDAFRQSVARDERFAPAHAGLADAHVLLGYYGGASHLEAFRTAREHAQKALEIDPGLSDAHVSLGVVKLLADRDYAGAEASLKQAIALTPNHATAHYFYGLYLLAMGRRDEAVAQLKTALGLDPLSPILNANLGHQAYLAGRDGEALDLYRKALALAPDLSPAYLYLCWLYERQGHDDLAYEHYRRSLELRGWTDVVKAMDAGYEKGGRRAGLEKAAEGLAALADRQALPPEEVARAWVRLGERDKALTWLEKAYERRSPGIVWFNESGEWESLRSSPRFRALVERIGSSRRPQPLGPAAARRPEALPPQVSS